MKTALRQTNDLLANAWQRALETGDVRMADKVAKLWDKIASMAEAEETSADPEAAGQADAA